VFGIHLLPFPPVVPYIRVVGRGSRSQAPEGDLKNPDSRILPFSRVSLECHYGQGSIPAL
jgi:hypothetical protein